MIKITRIILAAIWGGIKKEYQSLFKGAVLLFGVGLIGMSQIYPQIIKLDYEARSLRYKIEAQEGQKLGSIDCKKLKANIAECHLAKYQRLSNDAIKLITTYTILFSFIFGMVLTFLAVIGFVGKHRANKNA